MAIEANLGLELSIILFSSLLGFIIARKINQSAVIGAILIGIIIGPSALHLVGYDELVRILAEMGAIFLMFTIGLECKFKEIYNFKNTLIAILGVVVPFIMGFLLAGFFKYDFIQSMFIGTALTATSIAITANVLKEMGKLDTSVAKTIIGAAVVDDILGLIVLAITTGLVKSQVSIEEIALKAGIAIAYFIVAALLGNYLSKILVKLDERAVKRNTPQITLFFALTIAFFYSATAELIGLSGIVGAFMAGVSLESIKIKSYREGASYLEMVFSAIFFVSLGILVDLNQMGNVGIFLIALIIVAVLSKTVGCGIGAKFLKHSNKESAIIGIGMMPRGEVAMIVGLIGLTAGIITQEIYISIILMSLITTIIAPAALKKLFEKK